MVTDSPAQHSPQLIDILLVDDDEGDVLLTTRALQSGKVFSKMHVARDGVEAMEFLRQVGHFARAPKPDLILLDLNMPRKGGREVLMEIKQDPRFRSIPVVILTTSDSDRDIAAMYDLHANCFITKPVDLEQFSTIVQEVNQFWLTVVKLPPD